MEIFQQIGIDQTAFIQFVLFAIAITFLSKVVFAPYAHAVEERQNRTKGGEDLAVEITKKAHELQAELEVAARDVNGKIKAIVDEAKSSASKGYESAVQSARSEADQMIAKNRQSVESSVKTAGEELKSHTTQVALTITNKLLGK